VEVGLVDTAVLKRAAGWALRLLKGAVISLGVLLPGVSGGMLAAVLGLYEPLLRFLARPTRRLGHQLGFFLPVAIGGLTGLVGFAAPLEYALSRWPVVVLWGFAGAIIGSLPMLLRQASPTGRRDGMDWAWLLGSGAVGGGLLWLLPLLGASLPVNAVGFTIAGALLALGVLVPGLSPSTLLLILGIFTPLLHGLSHGDVRGTFLPVLLGALVTVAAVARLMERLLDRFRRRVHHAIIGLVLASTILIVIPTGSAQSIQYDGLTGATLALAGLSFLVGLALTGLLGRLTARHPSTAPRS
jgi:putative membrane protein